METTDKKKTEQVHDTLSRNILGRFGELQDSAMPIDDVTGLKPVVAIVDDEEEVIVRKVVGSTDDAAAAAAAGEEVVDEVDEVDEVVDDFTDEIVISCSDEADPAEGDEVTLNGEAVEDGEYAFGDDDTPVFVKDGKIAAVGAEQVSDLMKKVVVGGKVIKKKVKAKKMRMSSKQKAALKKAQKKSNTAGAKKARAKSMKVRKTKIHSSDEGATGSSTAQADSINLEELGDALLLAAMTHLQDELNLEDVQIDFLDENLPEEAFTAELVDGVIKVQIPVWTELSDEVELADFELQTFELELDGEFDNASLVSQLTDGEDSILGQLII